MKYRYKPVLYALVSSLILAVACRPATAQNQDNPLAPLDRSSPRATLKLFLESSDKVGLFVEQELLKSQTLSKFVKLADLSEAPLGCLDLSEIAPAARFKSGRATAISLYETLNRVSLPPENEWPEELSSAGENLERWVIPNTEIALVRSADGPRAGEFLFSAETIERADEFYQRVRDLPYRRSVPHKNLHELVVSGGGWMIPYSWVLGMPQWLRSPVAGQSAWKWIGLVLVLGLFTLFLRWGFRLSRKVEVQHLFLMALAKSALPVFVITGMPVITYIALAQINLMGQAGATFQVISTVIMYLASALLALRLAPVVAEGIIASPDIATESLDAHVIRIIARLLGIIGSLVLLAFGANRLGIPVYGIVAGLGVGGLAIALAAQPTIENLIGGMSLFADKPIKVGDLCEYDNAVGYVEAIGLRSTQIRGFDKTLTSIPNAMLAKMPIVNRTRRDTTLLATQIGLRYETTPEQLRFILAKLREMLLSHPLIDPEPARARFAGFGDSSLNIDIFAYARTNRREEFFRIQEDVFLRVMDIVEQGGSSFAFPSRTLYFRRDTPLDEKAVQAAEENVQEWRQKGELPFPDFSKSHTREIRGSIIYPPPGSAQSGPTTSQASVPDETDG